MAKELLQRLVANEGRRRRTALVFAALAVGDGALGRLVGYELPDLVPRDVNRQVVAPVAQELDQQADRERVAVDGVLRRAILPC